jgi:hypothetical protein
VARIKGRAVFLNLKQAQKGGCRLVEFTPENPVADIDANLKAQHMVHRKNFRKEPNVLVQVHNRGVPSSHDYFVQQQKDVSLRCHEWN